MLLSMLTASRRRRFFVADCCRCRADAAIAADYVLLPTRAVLLQLLITLATIFTDYCRYVTHRYAGVAAAMKCKPLAYATAQWRAESAARDEFCALYSSGSSSE